MSQFNELRNMERQIHNMTRDYADALVSSLRANGLSPSRHRLNDLPEGDDKRRVSRLADDLHAAIMDRMELRKNM